MTLSRYALTGDVRDEGEIFVQRGRRLADGAPVLIKRAKGEYPSPRALASLRAEHAITRDLSLRGVVRSYALERDGSGVALILMDPGGIPLEDVLLGGRLDLDVALRLAASLAGTLASL